MDIKFIYEETDIQDIKIVITDQDETELENSKDTVRVFCIDSLPKELESEVIEEEDGFIVKTNDGERALKHMFTFLYLVFQFAKKILTKNENIDIDEVDLSVLREDFELVQDMNISELAKLIGDV